MLPCARAHRNYEELLWRARRGIRGAWTSRSPGWVRVGIVARTRHTIGVITGYELRRAMNLLPERLIEWEVVVVGGWATAQARMTTHGRVHACTGGRFTSAWWNLNNPGGWRRWPQAERAAALSWWGVKTEFPRLLGKSRRVSDLFFVMPNPVMRVVPIARDGGWRCGGVGEGCGGVR